MKIGNRTWRRSETPVFEIPVWSYHLNSTSWNPLTDFIVYNNGRFYLYFTKFTHIIFHYTRKKWSIVKREFYYLKAKTCQGHSKKHSYNFELWSQYGPNLLVTGCILIINYCDLRHNKFSWKRDEVWIRGGRTL